MAFIVKGQKTKKGEEKVKPKPAPRKPKVNPFKKKDAATIPKKQEPKKKDINNDYKFDKNKTYLVVGGKVKEISSKSKYLLDMLIIEEEN